MRSNELIRLKYAIPEIYKISTNKIYSGIHWTKRNKIKKRFHDLTKQDCKEFKTIEDKVDIVMRFYFKKYAFDSSNCSFMGKMIEDSFTGNGLLKDDTNKFVGEFTVESVFIPEKERKEMKGHYVRIYIYKNK